MLMGIDRYIILGFAGLYTAFMLLTKDLFVKYLASLYAVSFMMIYVAFYLENIGFNPVMYNLMKVAGYIFLGYTFFENIKLIKRFRNLESRIYIDPLTGVKNRKFLEEIFKLEVEKYKRFRKPFCLIFIDLNNFKKINDVHGHSVGDKVLKEVAKKIQESVDNEQYIIRYGGDEFIVILETSPEDLLRLIEKLMNNLKINYEGVEVSAAIGSACFPKDGTELHELVEKADKRMYEIKKFQKKLTQA
ncbi:diguanylate cyclase [Aquifex sp.]